MNKICVVGSLNIDMVLNMSRLPKLGETLMVETLEKVQGGKGGNQACGASRLGSQVTMVGAIGNDEYGQLLKEGLEKDGINTRYLKKVDGPSGMAIITVDIVGNNTIAVIPGANEQVTVEDIINVTSAIEKSDVIISQFETPVEATLQAFKIGKESGAITILNPAPYQEVPRELLQYTDMIIPNETEAFDLTGVQVVDEASAVKASENLLNQGVKYVIITMGKDGAILVNQEKSAFIKAFKVDAVDTTAAGDSFIGAISSKINHRMLEAFDDMKAIVEYGNRVSSITVTKPGAQSSLPTLSEVEAILGGSKKHEKGTLIKQ